MAAPVRKIFPRFLRSFSALNGLRLHQVSRTLCTSRPACSGKSDGKNSLTLVTEKAGIRTITLNNPKKRNVLSLAMLNRLIEDVTTDVDDESLRCILIRAEGPVFSSGHDLKELPDPFTNNGGVAIFAFVHTKKKKKKNNNNKTNETGRAHHTCIFDKCTELMQTVQDITVPVIAEVRGLATAAGCQLVASCDIAITSENAQFATPGVNVGLFCSTPSVPLARAVPRKVALNMLFTGQPITAHEALLHGLVSKVVPDDQLENTSRAVCERICETSRMVTALGKALFYSQIQLDRNTAYRQASQVMVSNLQLADGQEGISAFIEKRRPIWTHGGEKTGEN